ncbi:MAG: imidazole glycerol phosphate synthase subunit HisH [Gallionella sp.]|nr:imidazole glycerol phosphate synthase subunit HisH [Gallionella sp.]
MTTLGVIDYRCGNLFNLVKALKYVGAQECEIVTDANEIDRFDKLVLPGVGSFRKGMQNIVHAGLDNAMRRHASEGKPLLGICAGLQLLTKSSEEFGKTEGLGLIDGEVVSLRRLDSDPDVLVPNIGWHEVMAKPQDVRFDGKALPSPRLFAGVEPGALCYFAHSYALASISEDIPCWTTRFNQSEFVSAFEKNNLFAVQFHPELSGHTGLTILKNFISI